MEFRVPFLKPPLGDEEIEAATRVMRTKDLTGGGEADLFEKEFASYIGTEYAISTNSGTSALELVLQAYKCAGGLKIGDKVLIPSFTFVAVANAVVNAGLKPVFADITPQTMNIKLPDNIQDIMAAIVVHTFGTPCDTSIIRYLKSEGVIVIEDCAEAMGARWWGSQKKVGSRGDCGIFSFAATKNMTTGDGGMITTNATTLAGLIKLLRVHGLPSVNSDERSAVLPGHNYRMCNILAAIGRVQLSKVDGFCKARKIHAQKLNELINMEQIPVITPWDYHYSVYQIYTIVLKEGDSTTRAAVLKALRERGGIEAKVYFYPPIHQQAYYRSKNQIVWLECTEQISKTAISLPMYPALTDEEIEYMVQCLKEVLT